MKRNSGVRSAPALGRKQRSKRPVAGTAETCGYADIAVRPRLERTKALIIAAVRFWEAKRQLHV
ncbi:MAG TPA: hypothetical protein VGK72_08820 [Chthoniobacterales bacterium]